MMRGTGSASSASRCRARARAGAPFLRRVGPHLGAGSGARDDRLPHRGLGSRPATRRIWIVISRATSDCHSAAEASTSITAPVVSEANVSRDHHDRRAAGDQGARHVGERADRRGAHRRRRDQAVGGGLSSLSVMRCS
jgi:hypothetical protein